MESENSVFRLKGRVQHYQWGGFKYIPDLLKISNDKEEPFAEYWLGAHDNAPAALEDGVKLNEVFAGTPSLLGESVRQRFGRLPYLLKVLDVKDMLSIQVHPARAAAVEAFEHENKKGIALNAPHRNYKDDNHKPELMVALSNFWLLHGFRNPASLHALLNRVAELNFLQPVFGDGDYHAVYELVMKMEQQEVNKRLQALLQRIIPLYKEERLQKDNPDFWAARAALTFNTGEDIDRGIFSVYLLNLVSLQPGQAVFQDAGILHAYLEGQNMEIMANSDNVLRGGLTPKHIDVEELMKHVRFEPVIPHISKGKEKNNCETVFVTPAPDFELSRIRLKQHESYGIRTDSADIFIVMNGHLRLRAADEKMIFHRGEAFGAFAGASIHLEGESNVELYRAAVPL